jgi:type VI secretion system secreted protein Hcp
MSTADYFLKIATIAGESEDADPVLKGTLQIQNWSFGETNSGSSTLGTGLGSGKVSMQDFHFTVDYGKGSPNLFLKCATGEHIKKATLTCRKAGGKQEKYLTIEFNDIVISSYQTGSNASGTPMDQISFNFTTIAIDYKPQDTKTGALLAPIKVGYDVKLNKKV